MRKVFEISDERTLAGIVALHYNAKERVIINSDDPKILCPHCMEELKNWLNNGWYAVAPEEKEET